MINIRFIQDVPVQKGNETTFIYTYVSTKILEAVKSPRDQQSLGTNSWKSETVILKCSGYKEVGLNLKKWQNQKQNRYNRS